MAAASLTAIPAVAEAQDQPWLRDRRYTEGIGYRVGDFELHPGLSAEFGYDSNYAHRDSAATDPTKLPVGSLRLRVTPSLSLSTLGKDRREAGGPPPDFEFRASLSATYNEFFPVSGPDASQSEMHNQRNVGGNLDLSLSILPSHPWSGQVFAGLARLLTPEQGLTTATAGGLTSAGFNRVAPRAGAELVYTPGSGLLDWRLGYQFNGTFFESSRYTELTNIVNQIETRGRWRFLPRTAVLFDAKFGFVNYTAPTEKTSSHPLRAQLGVNGLITSNFSLLAMAGWGASFYTPTGQEDFNSVIGQLELKWFITPNPSNDPAAVGLALSTLSVGFVRDFYDSYIGTYFERDRGYANFSYFFGGRFLVVLEGGAGPIVYPKMTLNSVPVAAFTDVRFDASFFGEYRIKNAFGINTTVRYGQNISNTPIPVAGVVGGTDSLAWRQFEVYLGARWLM